MSGHRDQHTDLCAGYVLGCLDPADQRLLEEHLAEGCATCESALASMGGSVVLLAAAAPPAKPGPELRNRVLAAARAEASHAEASRARPAAEPAPSPVEGEAPPLVPLRDLERFEEPRRRRALFLSPAWAVAASFVMITGILWFTAARLREQLMKTRFEVAALEQKLAEETRWASVLGAPGARMAVLVMTPEGRAELRARAVYDPTSRRAVLVFENFTPPSGRDYELWAIRGGVPASLGVIQADAGGHALVRLEDAGDPATLTAFAVSLEPEGGAPGHAAPTGPVVMAGNLGG